MTIKDGSIVVELSVRFFCSGFSFDDVTGDRSDPLSLTDKADTVARVIS